VHLVFDIFQGIGIAAAVGIRPFLPGLAAGALAAGDVELTFKHTSYSFLQGGPFLLVLFVFATLFVILERTGMEERLREGAWSYLVPLAGLVVGALFFAGELCRSGHAIWPGYPAGVVCALVGIVASRPFLARLRKRLDAAAAAVGLPLIAEGSALLIAVLSVVAPPVGPIALLALLFLIVRGRGRDDQKYAGLRILR
jgi:hypothetical protein